MAHADGELPRHRARRQPDSANQSGTLRRIRLPGSTVSGDGSLPDYRLRDGFPGSDQRRTDDILASRRLVCLGVPGRTGPGDGPVAAQETLLTQDAIVRNPSA